jgi:hypothetical protein
VIFQFVSSQIFRIGAVVPGPNIFVALFQDLQVVTLPTPGEVAKASGIPNENQWKSHGEAKNEKGSTWIY